MASGRGRSERIGWAEETLASGSTNGLEIEFGLDWSLVAGLTNFGLRAYVLGVGFRIGSDPDPTDPFFFARLLA